MKNCFYSNRLTWGGALLYGGNNSTTSSFFVFRWLSIFWITNGSSMLVCLRLNDRNSLWVQSVNATLYLDKLEALLWREEISGGLSSQLSIREIAKQLNRAPSTVSREVNRNGGRGSYRANKADTAAREPAKRPKRCKLLLNKVLARLVAMKLHWTWSPQQIAGWLMHTDSDKDLHVSHETIYKTLYVQTRGALNNQIILW